MKFLGGRAGVDINAFCKAKAWCDVKPDCGTSSSGVQSMTIY